MKKRNWFKKLDEDDILEILIEYLRANEFIDSEQAQGCLFGKPGEDLRFIGVFCHKGHDPMVKYDLEKLDNEMGYNGDHQFIKEHPEFWISPPLQDD